MWWYAPYWYRRWWRFSLWPAFTAYVAAMLVVGLVTIAVLWPLSLWGHALGMTPNFSQLLARSSGWLHQHYPLVALRYMEALLALVVLVVAVLWLTLEPGPSRVRVLKWLRAMVLTLVALHFVLPSGSSMSRVPTNLLNRPLNAVRTELAGYAIPYEVGGNPAAPGGLVDSSGPTVCDTSPNAGQPVTGPVTLRVNFTCATSRSKVPLDLIGKQLDIAEAELSRLHITYHEVDASQSAFGIIEQSNWTVCQTYPDQGQAVHAPVQLLAQHDGCE